MNFKKKEKKIKESTYFLRIQMNDRPDFSFLLLLYTADAVQKSCHHRRFFFSDERAMACRRRVYKVVWSTARGQDYYEQCT